MLPRSYNKYFWLNIPQSLLAARKLAVFNRMLTISLVYLHLNVIELYTYLIINAPLNILLIPLRILSLEFLFCFVLFVLDFVFLLQNVSQSVSLGIC